MPLFFLLKDVFLKKSYYFSIKYHIHEKCFLWNLRIGVSDFHSKKVRVTRREFSVGERKSSTNQYCKQTPRRQLRIIYKKFIFFCWYWNKMARISNVGVNAKRSKRRTCLLFKKELQLPTCEQIVKEIKFNKYPIRLHLRKHRRIL